MKKIFVILVALIGFGFVANAETMYNSTENSTLLADNSSEEYEYTVEVAYRDNGGKNGASPARKSGR